ncbi:MAG: isoleucine--tRNA ligase [Nitrospirales bacterium]|nr:isoleucine--tRNA ligase [Nitrospirales bacterium]NKB80336.1 isoleucine--tRNA ligase [Nitrospirales bacterium]
MDYKSTLNLPQTPFPMKANLPQREPGMLNKWEQEHLYAHIQEAQAECPLYILHDGPPYANGHIHIGHALNKILKDIIIKSKTMAGYRVPYIPGWDCHGLPIEHQVTKSLGEKKKSLSAIELRRLCREYAEKFYRIQREEFQRLGILGDWEHPYLTMSPEYESSIIREFGKFVEKGGVYKGLKPVLWCTVDQTALAEAEVEYEDHTSPSIFVKFPFYKSPAELAKPDNLGIPALAHVQCVSMVIWTTTPWTLPANQAICLHPDIDYAFVQIGQEVFVIAEKLLDSVAKACGWTAYATLAVKKGRDAQGGFEGLTCTRPLTHGLSPILLGEFVTLEQGTGCVHIAPGHGMDDYLLALAYNSRREGNSLENPLEIVVPVDEKGRLKEEVQDFAGQQVFKANPGIIEKLDRLGLLVGHGTVDHSYPHCWRCKHPLIFRATQQWFVSMEHGELRNRALKNIEQVQWIPEQGRDRIHGMIANRPDWCLSRQRLWGTPIPTLICTSCDATLADPTIIAAIADLASHDGADVWFQRSVDELLPPETTCPECHGTAFKKEEDILDVWFESGVSHAAVVKAHGKEWWPADLYLEGSDQHRGWFHSALLASITTEGTAPYKAVLTHGFVVDGAGKKMSKSAGNVVTPQEIITQHGADILRLWVAAQDYQEDLRISSNIVKQLVEAYRKIRNTTRFLLSNLYDYDPTLHVVPIDQLSELDRWAFIRLSHLVDQVRKAYQDFDFRQIIHEIDYFCAVHMSATYLDILKDRLYTFPKNSSIRRGSQMVLCEIAVTLAKLLAPILCFTAEEIWGMLPTAARGNPETSSIHLTAFPSPPVVAHGQALDERWTYLLAVRTVVQGSLEQQRREKIIGSSLEAKVDLYADADHYALLHPYALDLPALFIVSHVTIHQQAFDGKNQHLTSDPSLGIMVDVEKAEGQKCERCWNYRPTVGTDSQHPTICDRCREAIQ